MRRIHIGLNVKDLDASVHFYSDLFGAAPSVQKDDYAKWLLDDPAANIAISQRGGATGVNHVGIQVENDAALEEIASRIKARTKSLLPESDTTCCYARSNKYWAQSPEGARWELFHTFGDSKVYGADMVEPAQSGPASACC